MRSLSSVVAAHVSILVVSHRTLCCRLRTLRSSLCAMHSCASPSVAHVRLGSAPGQCASASGGRSCAVAPARRARLSVRAVAAARPASSVLEASEGLLDVVVVGAGVSGLCIAQALDTKHGAVARRLLVTEARERVGGNITTVSVRAGLAAPPARVESRRRSETSDSCLHRLRCPRATAEPLTPALRRTTRGTCGRRGPTASRCACERRQHCALPVTGALLPSRRLRVCSCCSVSAVRVVARARLRAAGCCRLRGQLP